MTPALRAFSRNALEIGGLRASRNPISVVVSPDGGHLGIITLEDIVEGIVGEVEG